jgi:hypothetical protein
MVVSSGDPDDRKVGAFLRACTSLLALEIALQNLLDRRRAGALTAAHAREV